MPASVTSATSSPASRVVQHVVDPTQLGVLVAHREAGGSDAGVLEQPARPPGVLAAHERDAPEDLDGARGKVAEVADRCRDEVEGGGAPGHASSSRTSTTSPTWSPHRSNAPASASITVRAFHTGIPMR